MANRMKTADLIGGFTAVLRKFLLSRGIYDNLNEAKEMVKPGQLMDYSSPLKRPYIGIVRSGTSTSPLEIGNLQKIEKPTDAVRQLNGEYDIKSSVAVRGQINIIIYSKNILELENLLDDLVLFLLGFIRILEEELIVHNISLPQVSETQYLEDSNKLWSATISIQYLMQYKYVTTMTKEIFNEFLIGCAE